MEIDWLPIINFVLAGVSSIVIPAATAWGWSLAQRIKLNALKIKDSKSNLVSERISQSVYATEQRAKVHTMTNIEKKTFCMDLANKLLAVDKQTVPNEILSEIIEAQIWVNDIPIVTAETLKMETPVLTKILVSPPLANETVTPIIPPLEEPEERG